MNTFNYYLRDAREGIRRNIGAAIAAILLIFISLTITGTSFLLKSGVSDSIDFLESQVKIKVFVDPSVDAEQVSSVLSTKDFVKATEIETKEETLNRMQAFFEGKEYLFQSFKETEFPSTVSIELSNNKQIDYVAGELEKIDGITDVIYAQEFAKTVMNWSNAINTYGMVTLIVFILISFLTVYIAINLALYQRQKDIRVKLLLGAKEQHVRGQFLFEGWILGLVASILAMFVVYFIYQYGLYVLQFKFSYVFNFNTSTLNLLFLMIILGGSMIGLLGSYLSTRKLIKHG